MAPYGWLWRVRPIFKGDRGVFQTVHSIRAAVRYAVRRPEVRRRAEQIVSDCPERNVLCEVRAIFRWVGDRFRFLGDVRGVETYKSPEVIDAEITREGKFQGDCDDVTGYAAALTTAIGHKTRLTIIQPRGVPKFRHIYPEVFIPRANRWLAMELTARQHPLGWQPPHDVKRSYNI